MPHAHGDLGLSIPASFPSAGSSDQSLQSQMVHMGLFKEGSIGSLLSPVGTLTQSDYAT